MPPTAHATTPTVTAQVAVVGPVARRRASRPHRQTARPSFAAEAAAVYDPSAGPAAGWVEDQPPFGLPVLAEVPALAELLVELDRSDRAALAAVVKLARLLDDDAVPTATGVGIEQWIAIVVRHTRLDRRVLLRTARLLHRLPSLQQAAVRATVSWTQLRGLALLLRDTPGVLDRQLDALLARWLPHLEGSDPDLLLERVRRAITEWQAELAPEPEVPSSNQLYLQPRLDGTGGRVYGELDTLALAIVDESTAPTRAQLDHPGGIRGARADNLLTRLAHTCPDDDVHAVADGGSDGGGSDGGSEDGDDDGESDAARVDEPGAGVGGHGGAGVAALPAVRLLLRCELADLLDATRTPVDLLTRLTGGSLRLTSAAARRLLETRGAQLRAVVIDDGQVVGVGRTSRLPPGRLRDIALAVHDTCTAPLCNRPARSAELDHARPWHPTGPHQPGGRTDADNLGPLCATTNRDKERAGWHAHQHPDGRRRWTHTRSGLTLTTTPATWHPPDPDPDPHRSRRAPAARDPAARGTAAREPDPLADRDPPRARPADDPHRPPDPDLPF
jgi:hypothetical protein